MKEYRVLKYLLAFSILYSSFSLAEIRTIFSLKEVKATFDAITPDTLVIFDVDETLIVAKDKIRRKNPAKITADFRKTYFENVIEDTAHKEYLDSILLKMTGQELVEPESAIIIKKLQERGVRVIALTHMHAGKQYLIESLQEWRFKQLYDVGIDVSIHNETNILFHNLPRGRVEYPLFYKGVLVTSRSCEKGEVLRAFLAHLNWKPASVIFFDDYEIQGQSVHNEMMKLNISCTVYHYRATELLDMSINIEMAKFQYEHLIKHKQWLSDSEAEALMK